MELKSPRELAGEIELEMETSSSNPATGTPSPLVRGSSAGPVLGRPINPSEKPDEVRLGMSAE